MASPCLDCLVKVCYEVLRILNTDRYPGARTATRLDEHSRRKSSPALRTGFARVAGLAETLAKPFLASDSFFHQCRVLIKSSAKVLFSAGIEAWPQWSHKKEEGHGTERCLDASVTVPSAGLIVHGISSRLLTPLPRKG